VVRSFSLLFACAHRQDHHSDQDGSSSDRDYTRDATNLILAFPTTHDARIPTVAHVVIECVDFCDRNRVTIDGDGTLLVSIGDINVNQIPS